jgi:glutaryl-CoA dehydrogenase
LKSTVLDGLYAGQKIGCFGLTEPDAGSDPSGMKTKAVEHNDYYVVNGSKVWITNSPIADVFVIWCKDESNKIIGLVSERNDSISTPKITDKLTMLSSPTGHIYFDNLKIPKSHKLHVSGLKGPFHCLNKARYGVSWGVLGAMESIINTAVDYTENRKQFNKSLNSFQLIQGDLIKSIELYTHSLNNAFASLNTIETFDDLENNIAMISFLKRSNSENALNVARLCRDMLGGNGVSNSYNIIRHLLNLEAVNTYEGTKNVHNLILGRELLGKNAFC